MTRAPTGKLAVALWHALEACGASSSASAQQALMTLSCWPRARSSGAAQPAQQIWRVHGRLRSSALPSSVTPWHLTQQQQQHAAWPAAALSGRWHLSSSGGPVDQRPKQPQEKKPAPQPSQPSVPSSTKGTAQGAGGIAQAAKSALSRVLPRGLMKLLPGGLGDHMYEQPSGGSGQQQHQATKWGGSTPAPVNAAAPSSEEDKRRQEYLTSFKDLATMDLKGYKEFCQTQLMQNPEPPVALPPVPMWHKDYPAFVDFKRATYLRTRQHVDIIEGMSAAQQVEVQERGEAVLHDVDLLREVALATRSQGREYMELEVLDCLRLYFETQRTGRRMLAWLQDMGQPVPQDGRARQRVEVAMQQLEARDWLLERMRQCVGPGACALHQAHGWAGPTAMCEHTLLPYKHCCGGKPMPLALVEVYRQLERDGVQPGTPEYRRRLEKAIPRNLRLHRRPFPLNHLLPAREGAPRQSSHDRVLRMLARTQLEPQLIKAANKIN